jgi:hypothetical protein
VIPPALLKVIEDVPQRELDGFKGDGGEEQQFEVAEDDGLGEPAKEVPEGEDIETGYQLL